jgi:hypothetical protein
VKKTEDDVLTDVLSRMVKYASMKGNTLTEYVTKVKTIQEIDTNDENGLFYVNIPDLQYLKKERDIIDVKDAVVKGTVESLKAWINDGQTEERKRIKKAFLSPFCYEGKELGNTQDHPLFCSIVCEQGYVFRTGRSIVMQTTPRNANFSASKPANLMCSEAVLRVTPGMCVKIEEKYIDGKVSVVEALPKFSPREWGKFFQEDWVYTKGADVETSTQNNEIIQRGISNSPNVEEVIKDLLTPPKSHKFTLSGGINCAYDDVQFGGEFELQEDAKLDTAEKCWNACVKKVECLVYQFNASKGCSFSAYYYGMQHRGPGVPQQDRYTAGWSNCEDQAQTSIWIPELVKFLADDTLQNFFDYTKINKYSPTAQRRRYTRHVERILDLFDDLVRRPGEDSETNVVEKLRMTKSSRLSKVFGKTNGIAFFRKVGSSSVLVKELKRYVNRGFQNNDLVQVNALVAAIKIASTKCRKCSTPSQKCSFDCVCWTEDQFQGTKDYCAANADDDVDADPVILEQMKNPSCPDVVRAAKEEAWDFLYDIPIRSRLMHTQIEKKRRREETN